MSRKGENYLDEPVNIYHTLIILLRAQLILRYRGGPVHDWALHTKTKTFEAILLKTANVNELYLVCEDHISYSQNDKGLFVSAVHCKWSKVKVNFIEILKWKVTQTQTISYINT